ncbi:hypothetical protein PG988_000304 [Apiospora saccharicola]
MARPVERARPEGIDNAEEGRNGKTSEDSGRIPEGLRRGKNGDATERNAEKGRNGGKTPENSGRMPEGLRRVMVSYAAEDQDPGMAPKLMTPKLESVKAGDIGNAMAEMSDSFWRACTNDKRKELHNKAKLSVAPFPFCTREWTGVHFITKQNPYWEQGRTFIMQRDEYSILRKGLVRVRLTVQWCLGIGTKAEHSLCGETCSPFD